MNRIRLATFPVAMVLAIAAAILLMAQTNDIRFGSGAPTGACSNSSYIDTTNGTLYICKATVWTSVNGTGSVNTIASGTAAMGTSAIASGACASVVTVAANGTATTDPIVVGFNADPTSVTGYGVSGTGAVLTVYAYPTANNVNFRVCNSTSGSITPGSLTLNWRVER